MSSSGWRRVEALVLVSLSVACSQFAAKYVGKPCQDGECPAGFVCHPERHVCSVSIEIGCETPEQYCPSALSTGQECPFELSFVDCDERGVACNAGCRTCNADLTWSECSPGCVRGELRTCGDCFDDCTAQVRNATPECLSSAGGYLCDYSGACASGWVDADGDRRNGCECTVTNAGVEVCDGLDNDCNGQVDEGLGQCQCTGGAASLEICDGVDNDCNEAIDDGFECRVNERRACDAGAGPGSGEERCVNSVCVWSGQCVSGTSAPGAPDNPVDLVAVDGEDAQVTVTFTTPSAPLTQCVLLRTQSAYAVSDTDAAATVVATYTAPDDPVTEVDAGGIVNGSTYYYVVFCMNGAGWNHTFGTNADTAKPIAPIQDLTAQDGEAAQVQVTYTMPVGATACKVMRSTGTFPADASSGTQVGAEQTGGGAKTVIDAGLTNGLTHFYAGFCRSDAAYRNNTVDPTLPNRNAHSATPIAAVADLTAVDGEDGAVTLSYSMPSGAAACKIMRKTGGYPTGPTDGTQVGGVEQAGGGAQVVNDSGLANATLYYYAAFCRVDGTYRNSVVDSTAPGVNADTGLPIGRAVDFVAESGHDASAVLSFSLPAGATACKIMRRTATYSTSVSDGTQVGLEQTGGGLKSVTDAGPLINGTDYYYTAFCRAGAAYVNAAVDDIGPSVNAAIARPIALAALSSPSAGDQSVNLSLTLPSGAAACKVMRTTGAYATNHTDGTQVGAERLSSATFTDNTGLTNGATYYYAAFCRADATYRNNTVTAGINADTGVPSGCALDTLTVDQAQQCAEVTSPESGSGRPTLQRIKLNATCSTDLTALTLSRVSGSALADGAFANAQLWDDNDGNGFDTGDVLLSTVGVVAGDASFTGLALGLTAGVDRWFAVVTDITASQRGLVTFEITDASSVVLQDPVATTSFTSGPPLQGGTVSVGTQRCAGPSPTALDFGVATQRVPNADSMGSTTWNDGTGPDGTVAGGDNGTETFDCNLQTGGASPNDLVFSDLGSASHFLHIDTGVPLNFKLCTGVTLRIYGTSWGGASCSMDKLVDFKSLTAFVYNGASTVSAASAQTFNIDGLQVNHGLTVNGCEAHYVDIDLTGRFNWAVANGIATSNLEVRIVPDVNTTLGNGNGGKRVLVPELYVRVY